MPQTRSYLVLSGFLISLLLLSVTAFYALYLNQKVAASISMEGETFEVVTTAAAEVSSYAKRAEGHLLLYLSLHRNADRTKFPTRVASLQEKIALLDQTISNSHARTLLDEIKVNSQDVLILGETLIAVHDQAMATAGTFDPATYDRDIDDLHDRFSSIRRLGLTLVAFEVSRQNDVKLAVLEEAEKLKLYLLILIAVLSGVTGCLGYLMARSIRRLQQLLG